MKIIFLDIDGVLNCHHTKEYIAGYVFVSDDKIQLLKKIIDKTGAQVVLSSTWRWGWILKEHNLNCSNEEIWLFESLLEKLSEYNIELLDYTRELGNRSDEISNWLNNHAEERVESYVILDDVSDELSDHMDNLVETDPEYGLTDVDAKEAIRILNGGKTYEN